MEVESNTISHTSQSRYSMLGSQVVAFPLVQARCSHELLFPHEYIAAPILIFKLAMQRNSAVMIV